MAAKDRPATIQAAKIVDGAIPGSKFEERLKAGLCPTCGELANPAEFKDDSSRREFELTGMCQTCQDSTFGIAD